MPTKYALIQWGTNGTPHAPSLAARAAGFCLAVPCGSRPPAALGRAQTYPSRPIRVIIPASAGGTEDVFMRALGEDLRKRLGHTR